MYHPVGRYSFRSSALNDIITGSFSIKCNTEYLVHLNHFDVSVHCCIFFFSFLHKVEPFSIPPSSECSESLFQGCRWVTRCIISVTDFLSNAAVLPPSSGQLVQKVDFHWVFRPAGFLVGGLQRRTLFLLGKIPSRCGSLQANDR